MHAANSQRDENYVCTNIPSAEIDTEYDIEEEGEDAGPHLSGGGGGLNKRSKYASKSGVNCIVLIAEWQPGYHIFSSLAGKY